MAANAPAPGVVVGQATRLVDLPGWALEDHSDALRALARPVAQPDPLAGMRVLAARALASRSSAQEFFESHFDCRRIGLPDEPGLLTGYFEPIYRASWVRTSQFCIPLHKRPADLVDLASDEQRAGFDKGFTHARRDADGRLEPCADREAIVAGELDGRGLELAYLDDPISAFVLHVQGSGVLQFQDGSRRRVGYDGKNGWPYTSVGRVMIERGLIAEADMTLACMTDWLRAHRAEAHQLLALNRSYIFFKALPETAASPLGVREIPLVAGRSVAVDPAVTPIGSMLYLDAGAVQGFNRCLQRLVVAHDVGSAIKGAVRADLFCGTGEAAGRLAGGLRHRCRLYRLEPKTKLDV
ncbi:MAG: murein transglycosylase A [Hyphomicrobiaceae bacterium]